MTQEEKQLLMKDLCPRLPYRAQVVYNGVTETLSTLHIFDMNYIKEEYVDIKPYLRPMSSMTDEEQDTFDWYYEHGEYTGLVDWLNEHHFDFRNLIEKGLAIDCTNLDIY